MTEKLSKYELYFIVENFDNYYNNYIKADIVIRKLETSWYGMRGFCIEDNSGYVIMFGEQDTGFVENKRK